ncbi:MAG: class I SAM-dependent methyltransferase [Rhizobiales bacterium]|nr:class I SAM-dependent methyltransferase [Hyphomicrobiales bacterium]NRB12795.1 class I SAM-dependent methyltransferase [Hyphomicrobiales bacterium]
MQTINDKLIVDFVGGAVGHRLKYGGGRGQALPKAIGLKKGIMPNVVDATAGLGRDAFLLASLGAHVTLIERSAQMHEYLSLGMQKAAAENEQFAAIMARMKLLFGDAKALIPTLSPEIILVDPMHPPRKNSALVKKEMRLIRDIVGTDADSVELMQIALKYASKRVVLKWPQKADPMPNIRAASHQIPGKSTRYDVFMIA